ncbi:MAG TPA: hypothetical protein VGP68_00190 [Gemmataceae bacterium]|jgi:hypothetical protein|nr:hypothetical protein [Gemmataceae bacterium]
MNRSRVRQNAGGPTELQVVASATPRSGERGYKEGCRVDQPRSSLHPLGIDLDRTKSL